MNTMLNKPDLIVGICCVVFGILFGCVTGTDELRQHEAFPSGHPYRCYTLLGKDVNVFEVLPGLGWDNLANKELGQIFDLKYNKCKLTEDGKYLIPDSVVVFPLKQSNLDVFAEWIDSMTSFQSATSSSVNGGASLSVGLPLSDFGIGGSFDAGYQTAKLQMSQSETKTYMSRVQARYNRYRINIQPDTPLNPSFKQRLLEISKSFQLNNRRMGNFLCQVLVRDYGTHALTSLDAGATYVKEDHIDLKSDSVSNEDIRGLKLGAGLSFKLAFESEIGPVTVNGGIGVQYGNTDVNGQKKKFENLTTHSIVRSHGGMYLGETTASSSWTDSLDNGLVPIDRQGQPIYDFISPFALPELPESLVHDVDSGIKRAFVSYYKHNLYRGCMDTTATNFDIKANVDDGLCHNTADQDNVFGGVFQTCDLDESSLRDLCASYRHKNPLTGKFSCPQGYRQVKLISSDIEHTETESECHGIWIFKRCHNNLKKSSGRYDAYWCAPEFQQTPDQKYHFGGMYTLLRSNELTNSKSCPPNFQDLTISGESTEIHVCAGAGDSGFGGYQFGGLFSCDYGNPLSLYINQNATIAKQMIAEGRWPKHCPHKFGQHFITVIDQCEIEYCSNYQERRIGRDNLPELQRPPFIRQPAPNKQQTSNADVVLIGTDGSWYKNEKAYEKMTELKDLGSTLKTYQKANTAFVKLSESTQFSVLQPAASTLNSDKEADPLGPVLASFDGDDTHLSPAVIAVISSLTTIICAVVAASLVSVFKKRFHRKEKLYRNVDTPQLVSGEDSEDEDNDVRVSIVTDSTCYGSA